MNRRLIGLIFGAVWMMWTTAAFAQQPPPAPAAEKPRDDKKDDKDKKPEEKIVTSKHTVRIGGQEIKYTATAGTILLKEEDGTPKASIFFMAYTRDDVSDVSQRPIAFTFNGGPGSASLFTHMGMGPKRVVLTADGHGMPTTFERMPGPSLAGLPNDI